MNEKNLYELNPQEVYELAEKHTEPMFESKFLGCPYPFVRHPLGILRTQSGLSQIKSDLLCLLLTYPGERVMLPNWGTPLRDLFFRPADATTADEIREIISNSIKLYEPRINVTAIDVKVGMDITNDDLPLNNVRSEQENIAFIRIMFSEFDQLQEIQELQLQLPLGGGL